MTEEDELSFDEFRTLMAASESDDFAEQRVCSLALMLGCTLARTACMEGNGARVRTHGTSPSSGRACMHERVCMRACLLVCRHCLRHVY